MKGIKGERKCYGMYSPHHNLFNRAGIKYEGTRSTNGYQKAPWYMYGTKPSAEQPDVGVLLNALLNSGWTRRLSLEGTEQAFPATGTARGGMDYESYNLEIDRKGTLHTLHVIKYVNQKKPEKNYISVNEITYPPC